MSTVGLFQSNWGYLASESKIEIALRVLASLFRRSSYIENFHLYAPKGVGDVSTNISRPRDLTDIEHHVRHRILPDPINHNISLIGYCRLSEGDDSWIQYRAEQLLLRVSAEDSVINFLAVKGETARRAADQIVGLASEIMEQNDALKEIVGRFRQKVTFFVGVPELLYRPKLLDRFYQSRRYEDAVDPFWAMSRTVSSNFPKKRIFDLLKARGVTFQEVSNGKILVRFCRGFEEIEEDGEQFFGEVREIVETSLIEKGIQRAWD